MNTTSSRAGLAFSIGVLTAVGMLGCASDGPQEGAVEQDVVIPGTVTCARTFDGFPAYGSGDCNHPGSGSVWTIDGVQTRSTNPGGWFFTDSAGYQCVELATRYFFGAHGVTGWPAFSSAFQMCNLRAPGVTKTTVPVPGDLMVWAPGSCGVDASNGHVAVVDGVSGSTITVTQQNVVATRNVASSCASCFLTARPICGGRTCSYGQWCGSSGQCCSGCAPGCPC